MDKENKEWMEVLDGSEIWTNAFVKRFDERVCVGIDAKNLSCVHSGISFKPTDKEMKELLDDRNLQEYGTTDSEKIMRMEGF